MTDGQLVQRALAGDRAGFGALVDRHGTSVFAMCLRLAGSVPDAEDLAHDSLVEAFLKLGQLEHPERFAASGVTTDLACAARSDATPTRGAFER